MVAAARPAVKARQLPESTTWSLPDRRFRMQIKAKGASERRRPPRSLSTEADWQRGVAPKAANPGLQPQSYAPNGVSGAPVALVCGAFPAHNPQMCVDA